MICAYLRMPAAEDVRRTAQRLLTHHLRPADEQVFWSANFEGAANFGRTQCHRPGWTTAG
jgi:hypothetical protein